MTARRDPDRFVRAFLEEGPTELPDRSYDAVRAEIDHTRQRVVIGPWRLPNMSNFARYGIAAAAIVVVAVLAFNLLPKAPGIAGPGATATPTPSPVSATVLPLGHLDPGTYYVDDPAFTQAKRFIFTVPAGWTGTGRSDIEKGDGTGKLMLATWVVSHIYGDVCQWQDTLVPVGSTVGELVSALAAQTGRTASTPTDVTLGGFPAKRIELITPDMDLDAAFCHSGMLRYWPDPGPNENGGLWSASGNHTDVVYAVDVSGKRLVVIARHYAGSSEQDVAELNAIVNSIRIEP
jgi:hypothetical protein